MCKIICPSMMCANYETLKEEVQNLDQAGADVFHIDVMDGRFVPNFAMGIQDIKCIRENTKKLVDSHLMIEEPGNYVDLFINLGIDIIYIHPEADKQPVRTLGKIKSAGRKAGIAINPGTSLDTVKELAKLVDYFMIMTVNPGFAGQKYLSFVNDKVKDIVKMKRDYDFKVMVDGAISPQKIDELSKLGVDGFVLGTSSLFGKDEDYKTIINRLKN